MARKPAQDQGDTLEEIRDRAFRLFGRYGYDGVSIDNIASAAGLSKGALYWHFRGKRSLYVACLRRLHGIFDEYMFEPMRQEHEPTLKLVRFFQGLASLLADPRVLEGIGGYWLDSNTGPTKEFNQVQKTFESQASRLLADTLRQGAARGELHFDEDADKMARAILAIMQASVLPLRHHDIQDVHSMLGIMSRMFLSAYSHPGQLMDLAREIQ